MTAEIALYNKSAVSLAADSAVTISGNGVNKIYNGAEKLFALTKHHPVGIMVYGAGSLCGIPWELIIKEYRRTLANNHFDTVNGYADNFAEFLRDSASLIPQEMREGSLRGSFYTAFNDVIRYLVEPEVQAHIREHGQKPTQEETFLIMQSCCQQLSLGAAQLPFFRGFDDDDLAAVRPFAQEAAQQILSHRFPSPNDEPHDPALLAALSEMFELIACKPGVIPSSPTGVVIAGYGDREYFPVVLAFDLHGFSNGKLQIHENPQKSASGGVSGFHAYAQESEVSSFMNGISSGLLTKVKESKTQAIQEVLTAAYQAIDAEIADPDILERLRQQFLLIGEQVNTHIEAELEQHIRANYVDKVVNMIEFLPKQDLAEMAESLVNLTAFKRKVSNESETVGGPIDVALISKGDGFIWVKRKHYFDKDLNQHYFDNQRL